MAYVPKAGSFALFKNDRKKMDSQPDYKGDGVSLDGTHVWVSAWLKDTGKGKFLSCMMTAKTVEPRDLAVPSTPARAPAPLDDDIPF